MVCFLSWFRDVFLRILNMQLLRAQALQVVTGSLAGGPGVEGLCVISQCRFYGTQMQRTSQCLLAIATDRLAFQVPQQVPQLPERQSISQISSLAQAGNSCPCSQHQRLVSNLGKAPQLPARHPVQVQRARVEREQGWQYGTSTGKGEIILFRWHSCRCQRCQSGSRSQRYRLWHRLHTVMFCSLGVVCDAHAQIPPIPERQTPPQARIPRVNVPDCPATTCHMICLPRTLVVLK